MEKKEDDNLKYVGMTIVAILFVCCCCCSAILAMSMITRDEKRCGGCEIDNAVSEELKEDLKVTLIEVLDDSSNYVVALRIENKSDFFVVPGERIYIQSGKKKFYPIESNLDKYVDLKSLALESGMKKNGILTFDLSNTSRLNPELVVINKRGNVINSISLNN